MSKALLYLAAVVVVLSCGIGIGVPLGRVDGRQVTNSSPGSIAGATYRMERAYLVAVHVTNAEIEAVLKSVASKIGLEYGKYDQVAFLDAAGLEQLRPREGSKAGRRAEAVRVPTTNVSFSVPYDLGVLRAALDAVRFVHSYEEPVIYVSEVWRSRASGGEMAPTRIGGGIASHDSWALVMETAESWRTLPYQLQHAPRRVQRREFTRPAG